MSVQNRKIKINPQSKVYYLIDANFLINKHLNPNNITDKSEKQRIKSAKDYWKIIDQQLKNNIAQVFILDVCIAECFKIFAKKYYNQEPIFSSHASYSNVLSKVRKDISLSPKDVKKSNRNIKYHDIQTNRDIIIGVDRYFEIISKRKINVSVIDIMILSAARYLIDYYGIDKKHFAIITQDKNLYDLSRCFQDLPNTFNPSLIDNSVKNVFTNK